MIEPQNIPFNQFPATDDITDGMQSLKREGGTAIIYTPNVVYKCYDGKPLSLQIVGPLPEPDSGKRYPIIVKVPGSAFHRQNMYIGIPEAVELAKRGFVVAQAEYRPSEEEPFPAQMKDIKSAVRYMKQNAAKFFGDPDKVVLFGDSSGGHTAMMAAFTTGINELDDPMEEMICTSSVKGVIDLYGPVNIATMNDYLSVQNHMEPDSPEGFLIGRKSVPDHSELVKPTVVTNYVTKDRMIPPILIFHGNCDPLVNFHQSIELFDAMTAAGKDATFYRMEGSGHGGPEFYCEENISIIEAFIRRVIE